MTRSEFLKLVEEYLALRSRLHRAVDLNGFNCVREQRRSLTRALKLLEDAGDALMAANGLTRDDWPVLKDPPKVRFPVSSEEE